MTPYNYTAADGEVISLTYLSPVDLMSALVEQQLDLLVGGLQTQTEISQHLASFWKGFKLFHDDHDVFREHSNNLDKVIPLCWHGDEGRGKRRGNTCVVSLELPIGCHTVLNKNESETILDLAASATHHLL